MLIWGASTLGCSVARLLLAVCQVLRALAMAVTPDGCPICCWALWAILGVVDLPPQPEDLAALVGALRVTHLQRHGGVVTLVGAQLGVINVPPGPWGRHAHLEIRERGSERGPPIPAIYQQFPTRFPKLS